MRSLLAVLALSLLGTPGVAVEVQWAQLPSLPDQEGFAGCFAGVSGRALVLAGGANFPNQKPWEGGAKVWYDAIHVLDHPAGQWKTVGKLPRPLAYGASISTEDGLLCIGGADGQTHSPQCILLQWEEGKLAIRSMPALPHPCAYLCGARAGNLVYVAGGTETPTSTTALRTFWVLDLTRLEQGWRELAPWPGRPRMLGIAAVQGDAFYLFSGADLSAGPDGKPVRTYLADGFRYTPGKGWQEIAPLPCPVVAAPSPALILGQSHLLLLGGDDGSQVNFEPKAHHPGFSRALLLYHTITDTWVSLGRMPVGQVTTPAVLWHDRFVIPSGEIRPGQRTPEVWALRVQGDKAGFGWLNYGTLGLYLGAMVWLGLSFTRRNRSTEDFFRAAQRIPWWAAGLSIFATMLSSITFMAIPAQAYSVGWNYFLANSYLVITPLVALVYLPFYRSLNVTSAYEYLERRFNPAVRLLASSLFILFQWGRVAIVLYLPALALATVSDIDVSTCIVLMGLLCVIYTVFGGIEAVIWTDVVQALVLMGGAVWAILTVVSRVQGGVATILTTASAHGKFLESVPWKLDYTLASGWTILVGSIFVNLFPYTASQDVVQRYLTTHDTRSASWAIWTNALIAPFAQAVFFGIGTALFVFYLQNPGRLDPTLPNDAIFPHFIVSELPAGIAGLIVAGIFAAAQSTLSSSLNSIATAYVTDFHRRFRPEVSDRACLRLARWITALVGLAGTLLALVLAKSEVRSLWEAFLSVVGLFGGTVSGLFVLGIFSRRAHGLGALVGAVFSGLLVLFVSMYQLTIFWCFPLLGVSSCVVVGWLASWVLPGARQAPEGMTLHSLKRTGL